jgi:hypothetical protein
MTRTRTLLILPTLGLAGALALTGCGAGTRNAAATAGSAAATAGSDVADEAVALQQVGFETGLAADPSPSASAGTKPAGKKDARRKALRRYLRKNTLHGEVTLQTKDGVKTVVVQRGSVTAVTASSVTVKSADGFTLSWTFGDRLRVVQDKKAVQVSALKSGEQIGVAGAKNGSATDARLIAIK